MQSRIPLWLGGADSYLHKLRLEPQRHLRDEGIESALLLLRASFDGQFTSVMWIHFESLVVPLHSLRIFTLLGEPNASLHATYQICVSGSATLPRRVPYASFAHWLFCHARSFS